MRRTRRNPSKRTKTRRGGREATMSSVQPVKIQTKQVLRKAPAPIVPVAPAPKAVDMKPVEELFGMKFTPIEKLPEGVRMEDVPFVFPGYCESVLDEEGERVFDDSFNGIPYHQIMVSKNQFVKPDYVEQLVAGVDLQVELYKGLSLTNEHVAPTVTTPTYAYKGDDETPPYKEEPPMSGGEEPIAQTTAGLNPTQIIEWANTVLDTVEKRNDDTNVSNLVKCLLFNRPLTVSRSGFTIDPSPGATLPIYVFSQLEPTIGSADVLFGEGGDLASQIVRRVRSNQGWEITSSVSFKKYDTEASLIWACICQG